MKRVETSCPSNEEIERLLLSEVAEEQLEYLAAHLDACESCRRHAESIGQQASLESDLHWATEVRSQTSVSIEDPLHRLSKILPEYDLIREIGRGGMGIVYMADQPKLHRKVAIKVLPALIGVVRPEFKTRFRREAELAAGLDHTNIISVYDFGEAEGTMYYTMQLINGRSLRAILTEIEDSGAVDCVVGPSSSSTSRSGSRAKNATGVPEVGLAYYRKVAHWIAEVADAMQYAHDHGVVHRDIKPSNLLLTEDGRLMISDFGLARPSDIEGITASHSLLGTARYMAPEQFNENANPTRKDLHLVDVYALGATLYEMLAFRPVFAASDDRQVVHQIQNTDVIPPSRFVKQIPTELETVCLKAISKDRKDRYATAEEFADDLRRWALEMPIHARRQTMSERVVRFVKRRKLVISLSAASLVLAGIAGGMYVQSMSAKDTAKQANMNAAFERADNLTNQAQAMNLDERYLEAIDSADEALRINPEHTSAIHEKAIALHRMGNIEGSSSILVAAIARDPSDWRSRFLHGMEIHGDHGQHPRASAIHGNQKSNENDAVRSFAILGGYIADIERYHPGSAELLCLGSCVEPDHELAITMLDEAIVLNPNLTEAHVERAARLGYVGRFAQALESLDQAISFGHGGHQVHGFRSIALYELGDFRLAADALTSAIQRYDQNSDWWYNRAVAYSYLGQYERTIADANETLKLDPLYAGAYMVRARAFTATNRGMEALQDFSKAIEIDPNNGDIYVERGQLYWLARMYEKSLEDANTLIKLEPNQIRGYQRRASTYLMLERWDDALADLDYCEQMLPNEETIHRLRGGVLFHAHRFEQAIDSFSVSIDMLPNFYGSYEYRAMSYMKLGMYQEAIADLTQWVFLNENKHFALMRRGMVYEIMGEYSLALSDYEQAKDYPQLGDYPELWSALLLMLKNDEAGFELLEQTKSNVQTGSWTSSIIQLIEGQITPQELVDRSTSDSAVIEAKYYIGIYHQLQGDLDKARAFYSESGASRGINLHEVDFAAARLYLLNSSEVD